MVISVESRSCIVGNGVVGRINRDSGMKMLNQVFAKGIAGADGDEFEFGAQAFVFPCVDSEGVRSGFEFFVVNPQSGVDGLDDGEVFRRLFDERMKGHDEQCFAMVGGAVGVEGDGDMREVTL